MEKNQFTNKTCSAVLLPRLVGRHSGRTTTPHKKKRLTVIFANSHLDQFLDYWHIYIRGKPHIKKASEAAELQSQSLQYDEWICDTCRETFQTEDSLTIHQLTECKN